MRNALLRGWRTVFSSLLFTALLYFTPLAQSVSSPGALACPGPEVSIANQSASSITFSWAPVSGASQYKTWYRRHGASETSQQLGTSNTQFTYSGLPSGTYDFYFVTVCGSEMSGFIIIEDLVL